MYITCVYTKEPVVLLTMSPCYELFCDAAGDRELNRKVS